MSCCIPIRTTENRLAPQSRADSKFLVTRESLLLTMPGLLVGIAVALTGFRLFGGMLIGVTASDPLTFIASAVFLIAVALAASLVPAAAPWAWIPMTELHCQ
jgi:ABC-type antimicrobial peptide transport system permease subunit